MRAALLALWLGACTPRASQLPVDLDRAQRQAWQQSILQADRQLQRTPLAADAPVWRDQIILAHLELGRVDAAQSQLDLLLGTCGPGTPWRRVHGEAPLVLRQADALIEINLRRLILSWDLYRSWSGAATEERQAWAAAQIALDCERYAALHAEDPRWSQVAAVCG